LTPETPWEIHRELYEKNYGDLDVRPAWFPDEAHLSETNIGRLMEMKNIDAYEDFYNWSITCPEEFWDLCIKETGVVFDVPYTTVFDHSHPEHGIRSVEYLPGAKLNIALSCFSQRTPDEAAIVYASETDATLHTMTFAQLDALSNRVANSLLRGRETGGLGLSFGDSVGICMAMTPEAVAVYLGVIKAGLSVVSIADSFSAVEIETRMRLANAKAIFTQDVVYRRDKFLPLFARISQAGTVSTQNGHVAPQTVILPGNNIQDDIHQSVIPLMKPELDRDWLTFLGDSSESFDAVIVPANHICNILFSSGTTGEPKVIPWFHSTPIKSAIDGFLHQDIHCGDVVAWPTNLGWMMGPWLLFQMINGATIALFNGVTSTSLFCQFVDQANVSMLGVVPSLVKAWEFSNATKGFDWTKIKKFSSSGEASDPIAMQWLMSRGGAGYKPIIEYCGGTEIAGSYMSSTMLQPNVPSMFSTPVLGSNFILLDHTGTGAETSQGEIALVPPALGLSTHLLNRDHHECYYHGMPLHQVTGQILRRHGDEIQAVEWSEEVPTSNDSHSSSCGAPSQSQYRYFRALGRCDDTMNLGGIKVSSVEIERVCNEVEMVNETAAIGVSPSNGGPSSLILFVILQDAFKKDETITAALLKPKLAMAIKSHLNPLFHVGDVVIKDTLPRTASNKVMRRILRDDYVAELMAAKRKE
jgi:acetyl-CoA synthetase